MSTLKALLFTLMKAAKRANRAPREIVLLPPAGEGSIGDQAMLDALCEQMSRKGFFVSLVYLPQWQFTRIRPAHQAIHLPQHSNSTLKFWKALFRSRSVAVVGADVIDGTYNDWMTKRWVGILMRAQQFGLRAGILNFSFSPDASPAVRDQLRMADGIRFVSRDPISLKRFIEATGQSAALSADVAFLLTPELRAPNALDANRWLAARKAAGDTILFVNLSGHTLSRMDGDGVAVMEDVLRRWLAASSARSVFLLPHDFRAAPTGDVEPLERLSAVLTGEFPDRVAMIRPPFDAWDVKALCGLADLAITGRMHLAIACLGMGVPVISVVYVGKFEGLMQHIGLADEDLLIEPAEALEGDEVFAKIERVTADRSRLRAVIHANLASVKALSARNFDWM